MKIGLHYLLSCAAGQAPARIYQETLEQAARAEPLGFESVWPVEHHFNANFSVLPCPMLLLAAIAARTRTLRLGTAIVQLPLTHPLRVAEEFATLDLLSGGRVELGVGRGSNPSHFAGYGVPLADSTERLVEGITLLQRAFREPVFSFRGKHYQAEAASLVPRPTAPPCVRLAANHADSVELAGKLGLPLLLAAHVNPWPRLRELVALYKQTRVQFGWPPAGLDDISLLMPLYVAEQARQVERELRPSVENYLRVVTDAASTLVARCTNREEREKLAALLQRMAATTYDDINGGSQGIFDTPSGCVERLLRCREELGAGRVIAWFNLGGLVPHEQVLRSMALFSSQVLPRLG